MMTPVFLNIIVKRLDNVLFALASAPCHTVAPAAMAAVSDLVMSWPMRVVIVNYICMAVRRRVMNMRVTRRKTVVAVFQVVHLGLWP